ncbi:ceramide synthase 6-like [Amphiura filiformis]|uniref:ceramide synthase 6-like n=1 Tax=Amphiura filiformis TaxID=82378 RepID=UPI003B20D1C5
MIRHTESTMAGGITWFWNERFWLPSNVTWADLRSSDGAVYPQLEDFGVILPISLILLIIRLIFERLIASPVARFLGVPAVNGRPAEDNLILEKAFQSVSRFPDDKRLQGLAKQLDWSVRRVERWFRRRRNAERPSRLKKFSECCWRFVFYLAAWSYGMYTVPYESWFWDTNSYWYNFPFHSLTTPIYNYYVIEASFYLSLMLSIFTDVRRKDFIANLVHHISTLSLLGFSWVCNFTRIGCLVLIIHDASDIFLETAKMANYAKVHILAHINFSIFALTFFVSRVVIFPVWVIHSSAVISLKVIGPFPSYYLFNGLLIVLYSLHLYWFYTIAYMVFIIVTQGMVEKDARSDVEETTDSSDETESLNGSSKTGNSTNHINTRSRAAANHH